MTQTTAPGPILVFLVLAAITGTPLIAGESIESALKDGNVSVDVRYRFEQVDQLGFSEEAQASTLRLRLGYETGAYHGFSAYADFEALRVVGAEQYDSTANGKTSYPVVADPEDEELNQLYLSYKGLKNTTFRLGRQRIKLDNDRFVGNVGWRQNEQTFDALRVTHAFNEKVSASYIHLNNVNRVFGEHHPTPARADTDLRGELLNASWKLGKGTLTGYVHLLEFNDSPAASHSNIGLRFAGKHVISERFDLLYAGEYAKQSDYQDAPSSVDAAYQLAELGFRVEKITIEAGYEVLEGDGTYGFQTPLATLHKFNGWTDRFLSTPASGIQDMYFTISTVLSGVKLLGVYHDFDADTGSSSYGSEIGLLVSKTFRKRCTTAVKYAKYDADSPSSDPLASPFERDTEIVWLTLQFKI